MSRCLFPIEIKNPRYGKDVGATQYIQVPCGKCVGCRRRMQNDWAFRIQQEAVDYPERTYFVTLSYDPDHVPLSFDVLPHLNFEFSNLSGLSEVYTLNPDDVDLYHKRLRRWYANNVRADTLICQDGSICRYDELQTKFKPFRYFYCGEYGDTFDRPHYHEILFSSIQFDKFELEKELKSVWSKGIVEVSELTVRRSKYVAKYTLKSIEDCFTMKRIPPYALSSRMPGIGHGFLKRYGQFIKDNHQYCVRDEQGTPYVLPRYYRERLFSDKVTEFEILKDGFPNRFNKYGALDSDFILEDFVDDKQFRTTEYVLDRSEAVRYRLNLSHKIQQSDDLDKIRDPVSYRQKGFIAERYSNNEYNSLKQKQLLKKLLNVNH